MPIVDHATRLITCKLVYYGPGRSGKTTNLTYLHSALPGTQVGELTSLATRRDRRLFFDYLPVDLGTVGAYRVRFQLYTVPGQPYYRAIRQLVLQGADGIAFGGVSTVRLATAACAPMKKSGKGVWRSPPRRRYCPNALAAKAAQDHGRALRWVSCTSSRASSASTAGSGTSNSV